MVQTQNTQIAQKAPTPSLPKKEHHYFRTFLAAVNGFIALNLVLLSILVSWLGHTLTNTDTYVATVSGLAKQTAVQDFIATRAAEALTDQVSKPQDGQDSPGIRDVMSQLEPQSQVDASTDDQLTKEFAVLVHDQLKTTLTSDAFVKLWTDTNRDLHKKLLTQVTTSNQDLELNFHDTITGAVDLLKDTKFAFISDKIEIPADAGKVIIKSANFDKARKYYGYFKMAEIGLLVWALLSAVLAVLFSVHHMKTLRRMMVLTAVFTGFLAAILSASQLLKNMSNAPRDKDLILAISNVLFKDLRLTLVIVAIVSVVIAVGSKILEKLLVKTPSTTIRR